MKIVFLTRLFYPHIGGVEKHVFEVGKRLIAKGHEVIVITESLSEESKFPLDRVTQEELKKFTIYRIPIRQQNWFKKFTIWKWLWDHKDLLFSASLIHCHDVFFWYLPIALINPMKPVFTTFHGYETVFPPRRRAIFVRKVSEYMSNKTIVVGEYIKKWYGTTPEVVTYGGIDRVKGGDLKRRKKINGLKITFIGRIEQDNGVLIYDKALQYLLDKKIEFSFTAVGEGSLRKIFENRGVVTGFVSDISDYIEKSDIIFASSYLSILETFSYRKPVFSVYQNPLKKDYLLMTPFNTWINVSDNPQVLATNVVDFYHSPSDFEKKIESASKWVNNQTWDRVVDDYNKLWR